MKYRSYARSPNYGRIISYDAFGNEVENVDVLQIEIQNHTGELFTIGKVLGDVINVKKENELILELFQAQKDINKSLQDEIVSLQHKNEKLHQAILSVASVVDSNKL